MTNGFSKKLDNRVAAVALYVAHYNLCRVHEALRTMPANVRRPLSRRSEAGIQPLIDMRGGVDLPDLLEKFISLWPWL